MIDIIRVEYSSRCVRGVLLINGKLQCATLELPWLDNIQDVSCIPEGVYDLTRTSSNRFGDTFEVSGVSGRTRILIHWGNTTKDTEGCILLGAEIGTFEGEPAVLKSRDAFRRFMILMGALSITDCKLSIKGVKL